MRKEDNDSTQVESIADKDIAILRRAQPALQSYVRCASGYFSGACTMMPTRAENSGKHHACMHPFSWPCHLSANEQASLQHIGEIVSRPTRPEQWAG
jgi:hypothetical protein